MSLQKADQMCDVFATADRQRILSPIIGRFRATLATYTPERGVFKAKTVGSVEWRSHSSGFSGILWVFVSY